MQLSSYDKLRLDKFLNYCRKNQFFNVEYPESADFDYSDIQDFFKFSINNCGDWSDDSNYKLNSFDFEYEVIEYFANLYRIPFGASWGYVTNGGTEGNMFGCYLGREMFPDSPIYYSSASHYSVPKIVNLLRMNGRVVGTRPNGEIDYDQLIDMIVRDRTRNPIVFANIGTTLSGAVDDIAIIQTRLRQIGYHREDYHIHADAALSGMVLPFVDEPQPFTFADGVDSIAVSGHKMIGSPIPCGVVLARRTSVERITVPVDYISADDRTISGSRNGHTPLMMWIALRSRSVDDWRRRIAHSLDLAQYVVDRLRSEGVAAWRNENSITAVFPRPSEHIWKRHCLAVSGDLAHLVATSHHQDSSALDLVIDDIVRDASRSVPHRRGSTGLRATG